MKDFSISSFSFNKAVNAYERAKKTAQKQFPDVKSNDKFLAPKKADTLYSGDAMDVVSKERANKVESFGQVVQAVVTQQTQQVKKSEQTILEGLHGNASSIEVLKAVNESEIAVQQIIKVRDKVVRSYLDILSTAL